MSAAAEARAATRWLTIGVAAMVVAFLLLDQPIARFVHAFHFALPWFARMPMVAEPFPLLSGTAIGLALCAACFGWRPGPVARAILVMALAVIVVTLLKDGLKFVFGRTWPETWVENNPSLVRDGVSGFHWFHGGRGFTSFPSGHTAVAAAPAAVAWHCFPRWRWAAVAVAVLVALGLVGANFHFLSDVIAGGLLGVMVGAGMTRLWQNWL